MITERPATIPTAVPVPEWPSRGEMVKIVARDNKIVGTLSLTAMGVDDVYVEGVLTYRGQDYAVKYCHTNDKGEPKGYYYPADGGGQVHGVLPGPGVADWARADFFEPRAPKTYVEPLLGRVAWAVSQYLTNHAEHAAQARVASITQDLNRAATQYNTKATEAVEALAVYETAYVALVNALTPAFGHQESE